MQGYNNLRRNNNGFGGNWSRPGFNAGAAYGQHGPDPNYYDDYQDQTPQQVPDERVFVTGRAGADAYPLPRGVNRMVLWDNDYDRFYIKGYDNNGRPRVLGDFDFQQHVEPEAATPQIDLSAYATKADIAQMIEDSMKKVSQNQPNMGKFVTMKYLDQALSELSVGNGGRIVRNNESNA